MRTAPVGGHGLFVSTPAVACTRARRQERLFVFTPAVACTPAWWQERLFVWRHPPQRARLPGGRCGCSCKHSPQRAPHREAGRLGVGSAVVLAAVAWALSRSAAGSAARPVADGARFPTPFHRTRSQLLCVWCGAARQWWWCACPLTLRRVVGRACRGNALLPRGAAPCVVPARARTWCARRVRGKVRACVAGREPSLPDASADLLPLTGPCTCGRDSQSAEGPARGQEVVFGRSKLVCLLQRQKRMK